MQQFVRNVPQTVAALLICALATTWCPPAAAQAAAQSDPASPQRDDFDNIRPCFYCGSTPKHPTGRRGLHWHKHWNRVGWPEYVLTPVLLGVGATFSFWSRPGHSDWTGPILFDGPLRDAFAFDSASGREAARVTSDGLLLASVAHTMVVDPLLVAWAGRGSRDVAWQLSVINAQAYALTLSVNAVTKRFVKRQRPWADRCAAEPAGKDCSGSGRYESFYSGHAAITATSAGLVCAHHTQLRLYKSELGDSMTCAAALAFTAATGLLRVSSDKHWATDVVTGHLAGYASGYLIPTLRFYKEFRVTPEPDEHADVIVVPYARPGVIGVLASGLL